MSTILDKYNLSKILYFINNLLYLAHIYTNFQTYRIPSGTLRLAGGSHVL